MVSQIKVVVVDGGGVLFGSTPVPMMRELAKRYPEEHRKLIESVHQSRPDVWNRIMIEPNYTEDEFWENIFTQLPIKITEPVAELKEMLKDSLKVDDEIFQHLQKIRASGVQLGILSNHSKYWMATFISKFGLVPTFDPEMIINSQEVAARKPEPKIYEILIDRVQSHISKDITPNEIVFIDDKPANVEAAKKLGLQSFVFNRKIHEPSQFIADLANLGIKIV